MKDYLIKEIERVKKIKRDLHLKPDAESKPNKAEIFQVKDTRDLPVSKKDTSLAEVKRTKKNLQNSFRKEMLEARSGLEDKEKKFAPITHALAKVEKAVEKTDRDIQKIQLPAIENVQTSIGTQTEPVIHVGPTAAKYLKKVPTKRYDGKPFSDRFGIYNDANKNAYMIGNVEVGFNDDNIIVNDVEYEGTDGLWTLLTSVDAPDQKQYEKQDYENYKRILFETDCLYDG